MASVAEIDGLTVPEVFLLDTYTNAEAAYSVRRLYSGYTGAAMRVRRDSDNTEQDIGFDPNGDLDTAAIASFVGTGNNGYIRYWYDQATAGGTGSGIDASQPTAGSQPQIYNGTSVIDLNGKPMLDINGATSPPGYTQMQGTSFTGGATLYTLCENNGATDGYSFAGPSPALQYIRPRSDRVRYEHNGGVNFFDTFGSGQQGVIITDDNATNITFDVFTSSFQGSSSGTGGTASTVNSLAAYLGVSTGISSPVLGLQEVVIWSGVKNGTDRDGIESNINGYFGVY